MGGVCAGWCWVPREPEDTSVLAGLLRRAVPDHLCPGARSSVGGESPDGRGWWPHSQLGWRGTEQPDSCSEEETLVLKPLEEQSPGPPGVWPAGGAPSWRSLAQNPHGCPVGLLFAFGPFWTLLGLLLPLTRGPAPDPDPPATPLCLCFLAGVVRELSMPGAPC